MEYPDKLTVTKYYKMPKIVLNHNEQKVSMSQVGYRNIFCANRENFNMIVGKH